MSSASTRGTAHHWPRNGVVTVSGAYERELDAERGVVLYVQFTTHRRQVVDYAVTLAIEHEGTRFTVRVYDASHAVDEMHRFTLSGGKQPGEIFHRGTLGEAMRAAIAECASGYDEMIKGWRR